ncbi:Clg1 cyclin-like protein [Candida orthopsilosis Co 90-125]|uniref:Clg1 cyclin-like protein n=1 Tax=Candida orthopsilosis (strain 90-125) TaxID=1136231 RepID=H8X686_CANO9|nr:Clg1 cyclin-like protein [Candida orthopsilosis Co 90-125]CCG23334.1 Clg1 cyclin-like protein [Candida orthopsilosis Co 90-125]
MNMYYHNTYDVVPYYPQSYLPHYHWPLNQTQPLQGQQFQQPFVNNLVPQVYNQQQGYYQPQQVHAPQLYHPAPLQQPHQYQTQTSPSWEPSDFPMEVMLSFIKLVIREKQEGFDKAVSSLLYATRLPKSTIFIGLVYLNQRFPGYNASSYNSEGKVSSLVNLVVALMLANKFNDDNTFTNKSWSDATGLPIEVLNKEEKQWLEEIKWGLSVVNFEADILALEEYWETLIQRNCFLV